MHSQHKKLKLKTIADFVTDIFRLRDRNQIEMLAIRFCLFFFHSFTKLLKIHSSPLLINDFFTFQVDTFTKWNLRLDFCVCSFVGKAILFTVCTITHSMRSFPNLYCFRLPSFGLDTKATEEKLRGLSLTSFCFIMFFSYACFFLKIFFRSSREQVWLPMELRRKLNERKSKRLQKISYDPKTLWADWKIALLVGKFQRLISGQLNGGSTLKVAQSKTKFSI